jgi:hypothetical protein
MSSVANMQHAETVLRGEKEDEIDRLPEHMQDEARRREQERQLRWDRDFAALQIHLSSIAQTTPPLATSESVTAESTAPLVQGQMTSMQPAPGSPKRSKWWLKFKRRGGT